MSGRPEAHLNSKTFRSSLCMRSTALYSASKVPEYFSVQLQSRNLHLSSQRLKQQAPKAKEKFEMNMAAAAQSPLNFRQQSNGLVSSPKVPE